MLSKMYLTNFLSFSQRTEFDFTPSKYTILSDTNKSDSEILKGALFIGANASGKTNALRGIGLLINLISGEGDSIEKYFCHFFSGEPVTKVEYEFLIENNKVKYEISYHFFKKELRETLSINDKNALTRVGTHGELRIGSLNVVEDELDKETLFLRTTSFNTGRFPQEPILRELMVFLLNSKYIDGYNQSARVGKTIKKYAEDNGVDNLNKYLKEFNYDFFIEYGSESKSDKYGISLGDRKSIFFKRTSFPIPTEFFFESQGNQVFSDLLPQLISVIEQPGMLVIDEFGNSLHNRLAEKIVSFFMEKSKRAQLFITSHDTNLISNSVFRPDQINVVSFIGKQGSVVKRVSTFGPREAQNIEKMYLGGMFEGLPIYDELQNR